jgi:uncharacterized membrane protein YtjA (UPF0391 family)
MLQNNVTRLVISAAIIALMGFSGSAGATAPRKTPHAFASDQALL